MRGKQAKLKKLTPDGKYNDLIVAQFINYVMKDGKKTVAEGLVYGAMEKLAETTKLGALEAFTRAMDNIKPKIELRSRRVGGANYQVPIEVRSDRQQALAIRWIVTNARARKSERTMIDKIAGELMDAFNNRGGAFKKKDDTLRMAEANRAFAHYRW